MLSVSLSCCGPSTAQPSLPGLSTFPETQRGGRPGTCSLLPAAALLFPFRCFLMLISVPFKWALVKSYRKSQFTGFHKTPTLQIWRPEKHDLAP